MAQVHTVEAAAMASNTAKPRSGRLSYGATSDEPPKLHVQIASPEASLVSNGNGYFDYDDPEEEAEEIELLEGGLSLVVC